MSSDSITDPLIKIHQECVKKLIPFILCIKSIQKPPIDVTKSNTQNSIDKKTINDANEASVLQIMKEYNSFEQDFKEAFSQTPQDYFVYGGITSNDPNSGDNIERIFKFYNSLFDTSLKLSHALVSVSKNASFQTTPPDVPDNIKDDISKILSALTEKIETDYLHIGGKRIKKHKRTVKSNKRVTKRRPRHKSSAAKHRLRRRHTSRK